MRSVSSALSLTVFLLVAAIAPSWAAGAHPLTSEALADDQTFIYRILDEPSSLDPQMVEDVAGQDIVRDLFEGLFNQDENGNLVPGVALNYELSDDHKTYVFHLRDTAKWSNGEPVTAADFVISWRLATLPGRSAPKQWLMQLMALENVDAVIKGEKPPQELGVYAVDDHTLEVRLSTPLPYFPQMTTDPVTFPVPFKVLQTFGGKWTDPGNIVSNGAYVLTVHEPGVRVVRARNPLYWDNEHTTLERVEARIIQDEEAALTSYFFGQIDRTDVPPKQYKALKKTNPGDVTNFPLLCTYYYTFNMSEKGPQALKDKRVRQALSLAINRRVITDEILGSGQTEAYSFTPPSVAGFTPPVLSSQAMSQTERDIAAKRLLAKAGFDKDNPLHLKLLYNTSTAHAEIATAVAKMWKNKLAVETELTNEAWQSFLKTRGQQNFEVARSGWCGDYNEASTFLDLMGSKSGYNDSRYKNPRVDELLAAAKTADNPAPLYTEIEQILAADVPLIPLYHYSGAYMLRRTVANWPVNNVEQKWYSKNLYKRAQ